MDVSGYNLLDDFRVSGGWWLPAKPEEKISGTLTVSPEAGVRLEIAGVFTSPEFGFSTFFELVIGEDGTGKTYTLHMLHALEISSTSTFRVSYLLAGRHFSSLEDIVFRSALVQYSYLEAWSCFQFTGPGKSDSPDFFSIQVPTSPVTLFKAKTAGPIKELSLQAWAFQRFTLAAVEIKPKAQFEVELSATADLRTFFGLMSDLGKFMTMLIGEPSYIKKLRLYDSPDTPVDVFFPSNIRGDKELHSLEMCFALPDICKIAPMLAENWFNSLPLLAPIYDLLFGTLFGRGSFVQTKFLNLTQALESFHRRTLGGTYTSSSEFLTVQTLLDSAIPANISSPLKRKLSDTIKYANEYSLRTRLKELLRALDHKTLEMLKISDPSGMAELIVKTRNYLTHFDEGSKTVLVDDILRMHHMNERLTALLFVLILKRLGIDENTAAMGALKRRYFE